MGSGENQRIIQKNLIEREGGEGGRESERGRGKGREGGGKEEKEDLNDDRNMSLGSPRVWSSY